MKKKRYDLSLAMLGFEWAAAIIGFTIVGIYIDRYFESAPWGVLICVAIGFVGGTYNFIKAVQRAMRDAQLGGSDDRQSGR